MAAGVKSPELRLGANASGTRQLASADVMMNSGTSCTSIPPPPDLATPTRRRRFPAS